MAKGYSIRKTTNYYRGKDGAWKGHSSSVHDQNAYTKFWPTVESAEQAALEIMSRGNRGSDEQGYIQYCKIYFGKECIKTVER